MLDGEVGVVGQLYRVAGGAGGEAVAIDDVARAERSQTELVGCRGREAGHGVSRCGGGGDHHPGGVALGAVFHLPEALGAALLPREGDAVGCSAVHRHPRAEALVVVAAAEQLDVGHPREGVGSEVERVGVGHGAAGEALVKERLAGLRGMHTGAGAKGGQEAADVDQRDYEVARAIVGEGAVEDDTAPAGIGDREGIVVGHLREVGGTDGAGERGGRGVAYIDVDRAVAVAVLFGHAESDAVEGVDAAHSGGGIEHLVVVIVAIGIDKTVTLAVRAAHLVAHAGGHGELQGVALAHRHAAAEGGHHDTIVVAGCKARECVAVAGANGLPLGTGAKVSHSDIHRSGRCFTRAVELASQHQVAASLSIGYARQCGAVRKGGEGDGGVIADDTSHHGSHAGHVGCRLVEAADGDRGTTHHGVDRCADSHMVGRSFGIGLPAEGDAMCAHAVDREASGGKVATVAEHLDVVNHNTVERTTAIPLQSDMRVVVRSGDGGKADGVTEIVACMRREVLHRMEGQQAVVPVAYREVAIAGRLTTVVKCHREVMQRVAEYRQQGVCCIGITRTDARHDQQCLIGQVAYVLVAADDFGSV